MAAGCRWSRLDGLGKGGGGKRGEQKREVLFEGEAHDGRKEEVCLSLNVCTLPMQGMGKRGPEEPACISVTNPELPTTYPICFVWLVLLYRGLKSLYSTTRVHPRPRSLSTHAAPLLPAGFGVLV